MRLKEPPSLEDFERLYQVPGVPVIIEGAFKHWKANEWTMESLKKKVGHCEVHVRRNTQSEDYRLGKKYDVVQMSFASYIDRMLAHDPDQTMSKKKKAALYQQTHATSNASGAQQAQNGESSSEASSAPQSTQPGPSHTSTHTSMDTQGHIASSSERMDVEGQETQNKETSTSTASTSEPIASTLPSSNVKGTEKDASKQAKGKKASQEPIDNFYLAVQNVKRVLPELEEDISPLPPYVQKLHMGPFLWIAPGEHYEYTHFDPDDGMLFVVSGEKRLKLYHYEYLEHMYPNPLGSKGRTIQSAVDVEATANNLKHQPLFSQVICDVGTLHAGDCLFIPAFYWHQVSSDPRTVSINTFYGEGGDVNFGAKIVASRFKNLSYWILNIIEQNRGLDSFAQVAANLKPALTEFFFKQWHERLSDEALDQLEQVILSHLGYEPGQRPTYDGPAKKHFQLKIRGLRWRD